MMTIFVAFLMDFSETRFSSLFDLVLFNRRSNSVIRMTLEFAYNLFIDDSTTP